MSPQGESYNEWQLRTRCSELLSNLQEARAQNRRLQEELDRAALIRDILLDEIKSLRGEGSE